MPDPEWNSTQIRTEKYLKAISVWVFISTQNKPKKNPYKINIISTQNKPKMFFRFLDLIVLQIIVFSILILYLIFDI